MGVLAMEATMPIPKPRKGDKPESQSDFMGRCMGDSTMMADFKRQDQRVAVCMSAWRDAHPGAAPPPKKAIDCMPSDGESHNAFMDRCAAQGYDHAACMASWMDHMDGMEMSMDTEDDKLNWLPTLLQVKGINEGERSIHGIATTPSVDHMGDIVESLGAKYNLPIPLLWQHKHDNPVGEVTHVTATDKGIAFQAKIARIDEPGELKSLTDKAWQSVKARLVKGVSIGFTPIRGKAELIKDSGGIRFKEWNWHELSLVTVAANQDATIQLIRSIDNEALQAAQGQPQSRSVSTPAGVTATHNARNPEGKMAKTISEDIATYANTRAALAAQMTNMMSKASEDGVTLDNDQEREYDELEEKIAGLDKHLDRLRKQEKMNIEQAVPVNGSGTSLVVMPQQQNERRPLAPVSVKAPPLAKGTSFTRFCIALGRAKGNLQQASQIATQDIWKDTPEVANVLNWASMTGTTEIKAPVAEGNTYTPTWAGALVQYQYMVSEFIDLLRPATILGRIPGFRRVPFNIRIPLQTAGASANWVGEGSAKPLSALAFDTTTMDFSKVAGIVVFTEELMRFSNPAIEGIVRQDLINTIAQFLDQQFLDPTKAAGTGSGGPSPASVTNGVTPITPSGTDADAARTDIGRLLKPMAALSLPFSSGVFVMGVQQAISLGLMRNALSQTEFPGINAQGGTLEGFPVITSENIPSTGGSPADGQMIAFLLPGEILLADDGNVTVDVSREASVQMEGAPDSPATASTVLVSFWQRNLVGLRAEREINWKKRRAGVVSYIDGARYA